MQKPRGRPKQKGVSVRLTVNLEAGLAEKAKTMTRAKLSAILERGLLGYSPEPVRSSEAIVVSPQKPKSKETARVVVFERKISLRFAEKNEDFRQLVRFGMGYDWNGGAWVREYPNHLGDMAERIVEIAHRLIYAGFITEFPRALAQRVLAAEYTPEIRRWVMAAPKPREGWLVFTYPREDDLYDQLKYLQGAEYDGTLKALCVRPVWLEEIEDCAEQFGFGFTPTALELLEAARAERAKILTVDVPPPPKRKPKIQVTPVEEIHAALRDDD